MGQKLSSSIVAIFFGHSITSSARPRSVRGTVMPRALMSDLRPSPCFQGSLIPALCPHSRRGSNPPAMPPLS